MIGNIKIRAYGKSELALLYFPTANSSHTAVNHLMAWVKRIPEVIEGLNTIRRTTEFYKEEGEKDKECPQKVRYSKHRTVSYKRPSEM